MLREKNFRTKSIQKKDNATKEFLTLLAVLDSFDGLVIADVYNNRLIAAENIAGIHFCLDLFQTWIIAVGEDGAA